MKTISFRRGRIFHLYVHLIRCTYIYLFLNLRVRTALSHFRARSIRVINFVDTIRWPMNPQDTRKLIPERQDGTKTDERPLLGGVVVCFYGPSELWLWLGHQGYGVRVRVRIFLIMVFGGSKVSFLAVLALVKVTFLFMFGTHPTRFCYFYEGFGWD